MNRLRTTLKEGGTAVFSLTFTDCDGAVVSPSSASWKLTDVDGNVVNGRTFTAGTLSGTTIVLSGDDLVIGSSGRERILTVKATYDSSYGSNLTLRDEWLFVIDDALNDD